MKFITALLMVTFLAIEVLGAVSAATSQFGGPFDGLPFPMQPMEFNLTIDGNSVQGHGTIQQVYSQYAAEHPSFEMPRNLSLRGALELKAENDNRVDDVGVEKRGKTQLSCLPNPQVQWLLARETGVWLNIGYLKAIRPDICIVGPRSCRKLACFDSAALIVCNWRTDVLVRACSYISTFAIDIINQCPKYRSTGYVGGQEDDSDNYTIIVRGEAC